MAVIGGGVGVDRDFGGCLWLEDVWVLLFLSRARNDSKS